MFATSAGLVVFAISVGAVVDQKFPGVIQAAPHSLGIVEIDHHILQKNCTKFTYVLRGLLILAEYNWTPLAGKEACPHCRKLITRINLPRHIRVQHMDSEPSECPQCFKVFKSSYNMKEHQRTAHGILQKCLL